MSEETDRCQFDDLAGEEIEEIRKYGITRLPVYHYQAGQYRYANLRDAVAQAEREALGASAHE